MTSEIIHYDDGTAYNVRTRNEWCEKRCSCGKTQGSAECECHDNGGGPPCEWCDNSYCPEDRQG